MQMKNRTTFALASTLGLVLALAASSGLASAMSYDGGDDEGESSPKNTACAAIGCPNGNRLCATAGGTVKAGIPPWVGEIQVVYTCYESPFF